MPVGKNLTAYKTLYISNSYEYAQVKGKTKHNIFIQKFACYADFCMVSSIEKSRLDLLETDAKKFIENDGSKWYGENKEDFYGENCR